MALWNSINVTCEGYMTLCCADAFNYNVIEDLNKISIQEAWHSDKMVEMRSRHIKRKLDGTLCGKCVKCYDGEIKALNNELYLKSQSAIG